MKWRRVVQNLLVSAINSIHVVVCRLAYRRRNFEHGNGAADAAPILVVRCEAKLGDNLLNIPFLRALRAACPGQEIHLLHHVAARPVYERCPYIDRRIEIAWAMSAPMTLWHRLGLCAAVFGDASEHVMYGLALLPRWDEDLYAPFLAWMSGAPRIVGFSRRVLAEKAWRNVGIDLLLTDAVNDSAPRHESQRPLRLLLGLPPAPVSPTAELEFWPSEAERAKVRKLLHETASINAIWVALAPGAALDRRKWPIQNFVRLAEAFEQWPNVQLLLLGTASETQDCERLADARRAGTSMNLAGRLSLTETAAALEACQLFVGNDSGLLHLACAVGTPAIEVSCHPLTAPDLHANSPTRFGPTIKGSIVLRPAQPQAPECAEGCAFRTAHCIAAVTVASAVRAVSESLGVISPGFFMAAGSLAERSPIDRPVGSW